jgi:Polyketide cyclase / dehydrase and lipid transport
MNVRTMVLAAVAVAAPWCAVSAPLKQLSVVESVQIKAPVDKVWAAAKDFDSLDKWHPGFSKDVLTKGANNTPGTVRTLTIKDGPSFTEQLISFNEATHTYHYKILESPLPVQHYASTFRVKGGANGITTVTWSAKFTRKNPADSPPAAENDDAAVKLITGVFQGGLANLKKQTEN